MRKIFAVLITGLFAMNANLYSANFKLPNNIVVDSNAVYVAAGDSTYTKAFHLAKFWKVLGKVAIKDTNLVDQDTIDIGTGVRMWQQIGFPLGNLFGRDSTKTDSLWDMMGDSANYPFVNRLGLSYDSLILATIDTSMMKMTALGNGGDSLWVSDGYFYLQPDPSPLTRFKIKGNSDFGATAKKIITILWGFEGQPVTTIR